MMNKRLYLLVSILFISIFHSIARESHVDVFLVDVQKSSVQWFATKFTGKHEGTIRLNSGEISSNHGHLSGNVVVDMTSITVSDIKDEKMNAKLTNHLKSDDFFNVETYPTSSFVITTVLPIMNSEDGSTHVVKGNLTIKDKTNEITFNATIVMQENKITCVGSAVVDRSKFDVRYGSKTFFEDIGDKVIYDDFTVKFNLIAEKQ